MSDPKVAAAAKGSAASDAEWLEALYRHLAELIPEALPGGPALLGVEALADDVWLARLSDRGQVVVKHQFYGLLTEGRPYDLLQMDAEVLDALRGAGCAVPLVFGVDPRAQVIFLEYVGPRTLAQALAEDEDLSPRRRRDLTRQLFGGLVRIEAALAAQARWQQRVVPGGGLDDLTRAWDGAVDGAVAGLAAALGGPAAAESAPLASAEADLRALGGALGRRPACLGPTDYQPGNLVLDGSGERLTFLEQGKLGWDWTERRVVQYATWAAAPDRGGLVDAESAGAYGELWDGNESVSRRRALDGHHLIFHLLWVRRLSLEGDGAGVPEAVVHRLIAPLSDDPLTGQVRGRIARGLGAGAQGHGTGPRG